MVPKYNSLYKYKDFVVKYAGIEKFGRYCFVCVKDQNQPVVLDSEQVEILEEISPDKICKVYADAEDSKRRHKEWLESMSD